MAFSINTNIASLQAQNYLRTSSEFQSKTINRVTSGLRIVSSGDDAAGLAIANGFRSDEAVLSQGIRNANDGLSTLQTIDGGMSNISQLLDRARTLATQSASGTFSGDRGVLNSEFKSVMTEIDRQSQSIGLNTNGEFAKSLQVFIGGGKGTNSASVINNGSVSVDLSKSTVDTTSLGLNSFRATQGSYDLSSKSTTSVKSILANATNTVSEAGAAGAGKVRFTFSGAGFSDSSKITVDVNVAAVQNTDDLVNAINSAIATAASPTTATTASTAFKNAGVTASIVTDSDGKQQLSFSAPNTAFQVAAGDQAANALMGNIQDSSTGAGRTLNTYLVGANDIPVAGASGAASTIYINGSTSDAITFTSSANANIATMVSDINTAISGSGNANLYTGGAFVIKAFAEGNKIRLENTSGASFTAYAKDAASATNTGLNVASSVSTTTATPATASQNDVITINGTAVTVAVLTGDTTAAALATKFNTAIAAAATGDAIEDKFFAYSSAANTLVIASKDGSQFTIGGDTNAVADFGVAAVATPGSSSHTSIQAAKTSSVDAGGANISSQVSDTKAYTWTALAATETQTLTFSGKSSDGTQFSWSTDLTSANTNSKIDTAISTLNSALQASGNTELAKIVAVKDTDSKGAQGIRFMSPDDFSVKLGATVGQAGNGLSDGSTSVNNGQGAITQSTESEGSGTVDISNQSAAQNAVTALANAVTALGTAQAVVGKGQNNFNFAATLAQSQLTNLAAAESRIRDADLANEAANLSKAQILVQAGTAALAQANSAPQAILSLLRG